MTTNKATNDCREFLETVWHSYYDEGHILIWTLPSKNSTFCDSVETAIETALNQNGSDVYYGVGLALENKGKNKRGDTANICAIPGLVADIDVEGPGHSNKTKTLFETREKALEFINTFPLKPTATVWSGGGWQCVWTFNELEEIIDDKTRAATLNLAKGWHEFLNHKASLDGYVLDSVWDSTRVMRVPGTFNHKTGTPRPVELVDINKDRLYNPDDFEPYISAIPEKAKTGVKHKTISVGNLTLNAAAEPPFEKFEALLCNIPEFKKSWERTRTDLKDASASSYDMALANICAKAEWSPQETVDLLIAGRRKHGDNLKIRESYYGKTIDKAFAPVQTEQKMVASLDAIIATIKKPTDWSREVWDKDERDQAIIGLQKALALPIISLDKYGKNISATYKVTFEKNIVHNFFCVDDFESQKIWHNISAAIFLSDPLHSSKNTWAKVVKIMRQLITEHDEQDFAQETSTIGLILNFCGEEPCTVEEATDPDMPFLYKGELFLKLPALLDHIREARLLSSRLSPQIMGSLLTDVGFKLRRTKRPGSEGKTVRYWVTQFDELISLKD